MSKAAETRQMILQRSFELIYRQGYQATSIDNILATTQVTKGAFFYHFKSKDDMGLAMINEILYPGMYASLVTPLLKAGNPVNEIYQMMRTVLLKVPFLQAKYGCPAINMIDEMAPLNDDFRKALVRLTQQWQNAIAQCLEQGKETGEVRGNVNTENAACFIVAGYGGIRNMGKALGSDCYRTYLKELENYLMLLE
ncbi:TetR/AcrR family transcriptional regulator [Mucilaginibacter conchicola]|uniref:TetR/AcrR family transcriptional regulator n=1 Tax=Mucilaginibacter conchicola TaxID=2303333 RepID=A0A372NRE5_9SPHI|nr:TetR/AcrR family transcriptional regulator [Mucilaginibacter conchicola]RFZ91712.1 TetR/AcrR family transcriptional regulator [Mucilaginibacter conchicola]